MASRKQLSAEHKQKISEALKKKQQKKGKKREGFFKKVKRIRKENKTARKDVKSFEKKTRNINDEELVNVMNKVGQRHGYENMNSKAALAQMNRSDNLAKIYNYKSGKDFKKHQKSQLKSREILKSRKGLSKFI